jgi:transcription factor RLM1
MENGLLPSPSSFYPDWPFGGRDSAGGAGSNMLPSPLTFQTPVNTHGPSFRDEDPGSTGKRKLEGQPAEGVGQGKRIKT